MTITDYYRLGNEQSSAMFSEIVAGTLRSASLVYMWMRGESLPCFREQLFIQQVVKKIFGQKVPLEELFPKNQ